MSWRIIAVYKNNGVEIWLSISNGLFHDLKPEKAGDEIFGRGMQPDKFAALVDRETERVNTALVAMSLADGKTGVHGIFDALSRDTIIALFSRWAHYHEAWLKMLNDPDPHLWIPPNDIWRAIFLAMTDDVPAASDAIQSIWKEDPKG